MIAKRITGATHRLSAPKGWDEKRDGHCHALSVRLSGGNVFESAWEPTPDELAALNAGGSIVLSMVGGQLPVILSVEPPDQAELKTVP